MSFLTPLYILGLATISLPILFHLIRRTPKGVQPFSSLMFVAPTPPRLTRRSRLDQLLLLLLRAAIICLLAFAFARPFLRRSAETDMAAVSDRMYGVLIDTSGSMQRAGIWQQVESELEGILEDLGPNDVVTLYCFSDRAERIASVAEAMSLEPASRADLIRKRFAELKPTWGASELGKALVLAADDLDAIADTGSKPTRKQLVVISDLQEGSRIEALQAFQWPPDVHVEFRQVAPAQQGNASLQMLESLADAEDERGVKVRVENSPDAVRSQFDVGWADSSGTGLGRRIGVSVPPGESRVVHVPRLSPDASPTHLQLYGDSHEFDDRFYVATLSPTAGTLVYIGNDSEDDPDQLLYYLKRAVTNDRWQPVDIVTDTTAARAALESDQPLLVVITTSLDEELLEPTRRYLDQGGRGLLVLSAAEDLDTAEQLVEAELGSASVEVPDDYVLWSEIDFSHYFFQPFANLQFNDFSKIYFWKYCRLDLPDDGPAVTLVRYDNGDAAMIECAVGKGSLTVLTSAWRPEENQLARSSKFVPLLLRMTGSDAAQRGAGYLVNEPIDIDTTASEFVSVTKPDGAVVPLAGDDPQLSTTDQPGIYRWQAQEQEQLVAVNLHRAETRTSPLDVAQLEMRGVRLDEATTFAEEVEEMRQAPDIELEAQQSVWQWLIAAALALIILETILAGRWSMQTSNVAT